MRMSHTNYKNVIKGLGGDPMRFLLLLVHTLNVLSINLLQVQGLFFWFVNVTLSQTAYSCTNPKSRDSRLELDNSRLTLDEKCLIRDEN